MFKLPIRTRERHERPLNWFWCSLLFEGDWSTLFIEQLEMERKYLQFENCTEMILSDNYIWSQNLFIHPQSPTPPSSPEVVSENMEWYLTLTSLQSLQKPHWQSREEEIGDCLCICGHFNILNVSLSVWSVGASNFPVSLYIKNNIFPIAWVIVDPRQVSGGNLFFTQSNYFCNCLLTPFYLYIVLIWLSLIAVANVKCKPKKIFVNKYARLNQH